MSKKQYDNFYNFLTGSFDIEKYSKDKKTIADTIGANILNKMQSAFKWDGLPETIPQKWLEIMLMRYGYCVITEIKEELYAMWGGLGGEYDEYYQPTICTISNPWLDYSANVNIYRDTDGVLVSNDTLRRGIIPIVGKYAGLLAENTITMRIADILARVTQIISAGDESTITSAEEYIKQLEDGKLSVIEESPFLSDLKVQGSSAQAHSQITDLIELEQYLKASLYNELGLEANYNMKRESINSNESQLNKDAIRPYIENMLMCRKEAANRINARYGTNITVDLATVWKETQEQAEAETAIINNEADQKEGADSDTDSRSADNIGNPDGGDDNDTEK